VEEQQQRQQHRPCPEELRHPSSVGAASVSERAHEVALPFDAVVTTSPPGSLFRRTWSRKAALSEPRLSLPSQGAAFRRHPGPAGLLRPQQRPHRPWRRLASTSASVNTSVVMDGFSFRCVACSRPPAPRLHSKDSCAPVVPGPQAQVLIEKLDRQKGVRRSPSPASTCEAQWRNSEPAIVARPSDEVMQTYEGRAFDGCWEAHADVQQMCSDWIRRFHISAGGVVLGDGEKTQLTQRGTGGPVYLCNGEVWEVWVEKGGRLFGKAERGGRSSSSWSSSRKRHTPRRPTK